LELATLLQPDAKRVVVVVGASDFDTHWEANAKRRLATYASRYEFAYLVGLPFDELPARLRSLPRDTIVLFTTMFAGGAGKTFPRSPDLVPEISSASSAPIYALYDTSMERGIVGGHMNTFEGTGMRSANLR
jgi:hypothetical protein